MIHALALGAILLSATSQGTGTIQVRLTSVERVRVSANAIARQKPVERTTIIQASSPQGSHQYTVDVAPCEAQGISCDRVFTLRYE